MLGLFSVLGVVGLYYQFQEPNADGIPLFLGITLVPAWLVAKMLREEMKAKRFLEHLFANRDLLAEGTLRFENYPVTMDTTLRRYTFTISVGLVTMKTPTRFFIDGSHLTTVHSLANSLISFLFGWWGLPWGIPLTIQSIVSNTKGGEVIRVRDLVNANLEIKE